MASTTSKFFKTGNSYGLRLTKQDKEILNVEPGAEFTKEVSPDGSSIIFRKKQEVNQETMAIIDMLYNKNAGAMERLKDQ
ncbi:hypothetical protein [Limosilactobacillus ingluviei]|uniref:hypothetical protein n=1 Tax=Limosilactobacillus ingluviei TaxID=148604 RepID=UPI0003029243|nr:hypothetical protein [Limosilactobacillus ingluviei]